MIWYNDRSSNEKQLFSYLYILLFVCLFVCLCPINVKIGIRVGPKFCVELYMTPEKVYSIFINC